MVEDYEPSPVEIDSQDISAGVAPPSETGGEPAPPEQEAPPPDDTLCCEVAFDMFDVDLDPEGLGLWKALEECATVSARPGQKRRVEVSFRKLGPTDPGEIPRCNAQGVAELVGKPGYHHSQE